MRFFILIIMVMTLSTGAEAAENAHKGKPNKLAGSSSPYLLQHAYNPVDWYPWGEEAFAKARKENKPILLSIGYSTCYWCHVMEREVFENPEIAKLMNESIVSIKIDREQRPDVDEIYMTATQIITRRGGWPNNVFVTPDLKPFFAGTYFPPEDSFGRPGFVTVIKRIRDQWEEDQADTQNDADRLVDTIIRIKQQENDAASATLPGQQVIDALIGHYRNYYDNRLGGFYPAPKFPHEDALLFLLEAYRLTNNNSALDMARGTLEKMAEGGIHDHVGGGFHRYSTDARWHIPHFEKMLYNQALLGRAYTELYALSNTPVDRAIAEGTFDFTLRQMTHKGGGLYSALDAETDEVEGAYYAWTDAELKKALDKNSYAWLTKHYGLADIPDIRGHKNTDGKVPYLKQPLTEVAVSEGMSYEAIVEKRQKIMTALRKARDQRKLPYLDNKIIPAWNGLMIDAFARAGEILERPDYVRAASRASDFILANLRKKDGTLYRTWREGKAEIIAYFEDYAFMIQGLVSTYRVTKEETYLTAAKELAETAKRLFWDAKNGGYYFTDGSEELLVRMKNAEDSAIPSGNAVMANALLDLYEVTGDTAWKKQAEMLLKAFGKAISDNPRGYTHMAQALLRLNYIIPAANTAPEQTEAPTSQDAIETKAHVKISATEPKREGDRLTVTAILDIAEGWHINANPASLDFLIHTSVDVREDSGTAEAKPDYPSAKAMTTPLGDVKVYEGKVSIPVTVTLPRKTENLRLLIRAQACKDTTCLAPSDWVILLTTP